MVGALDETADTNPPPDEDRATGTDGNVVPFPVREIDRQKPAPNKTAKPAKPPASKKSPTVRKSPKKRKAKPPKPKGYYWRNDSAGFELRRSRDDDYVARLSGRKWAEMKRSHKGAALTRAVRAWADQKIAKDYPSERVKK